jgi:hypothetical protein
MKFDKRQAMKDMIEAAAKDQQKQFEWIGNLYRQRLQNLQETEAKRQEWLKTQQKTEDSDDDLA